MFISIGTSNSCMNQKIFSFPKSSFMQSLNLPAGPVASSSSSVYRHLFSMSELEYCRGEHHRLTPIRLRWSQTVGWSQKIIWVGIKTNDNPSWNLDLFLAYPPCLNFLFHQNCLFTTTNDNIW